MTSVAQDLRFALRALSYRPFVTGVAVLSLAIGIAMSAGVFSLLDAAVLRPLAVRDPDSLRVILELRDTGENHNFTYPGFMAYSASQQSFSGVAAYSTITPAVRRANGTAVLAGELVSGSYFETLGPGLWLGRGLTEVDNQPDAPPVVVLSRSEWRIVGGDAASIGTETVQLNGTTFSVVGVTEADYRGTVIGRDARFWAPVVHQPLLDPFNGENFLTMDTVSWLTVIGRVRDGADDESAIAELNVASQGLTQTRPGVPARFTLAPGGQGDSRLPELTAGPLQLLLGASLVVLLVACANVASLLLARTSDRSREIAVRTALGATRTRIARLLFVEAFSLAAVGVVLGVAAATWIAPMTVTLFAQFGEAVSLDVGLNGPVLLFAAGLGVVAATGAGLAPVLRVWRVPPAQHLAEGGRSASASPASVRWRRGLVVAQFALTVALVATSALFVRTLINLRSIPTGLDVDHVALLSVDPQAVQYDNQRIVQYFLDAEARLAAVPGVRAAGYGRVIPIGFGGSRMTIGIPGYEPEPAEDMEINYNVVSPGYFDAVGLQMRDGRPIDDIDIAAQAIVVVVNETMAGRYWPTGRAVGREVMLGDTPAQVVGIVADVKYRTLRESPRPSFYLALAQSTRPRGGVLHVRIAGDPDVALDGLRRAVAEVDPTVPIGDVRTLAQQVTLNVNRERVTMLIGLSLGIAALLLSAVGLFGAMANLVGRRRRELGLRLALGAVPRQIGRLVLREGLSLSMAGSLLGLALAVWVGRLVENSLFGVGAFDVPSLLGAVFALSVVALGASWAPARRAAQVDPIRALRID